MDTKTPGTIWSKPAVERLGPGPKLALFWLRHNSALDLAGYLVTSERRFVYETGCEPEDLPRALEALPKDFEVLENGEEGQIIWLRNYVAEQIGTGAQLAKNHMGKAVCRALAKHFEGLREPFFEEYPELREIYLQKYGIDPETEGEGASPSEGLGKPLARTREERRGEEERGEERSTSILQMETDFVTTWNARTAETPISGLRGKIPQRCRAAWNARRKDPEWLEGYDKALAHAVTKPFNLGESERGWVADIEWFLRPHTVPKLLAELAGVEFKESAAESSHSEFEAGGRKATISHGDDLQLEPEGKE